MLENCGSLWGKHKSDPHVSVRVEYYISGPHRTADTGAKLARGKVDRWMGEGMEG